VVEWAVMASPAPRVLQLSWQVTPKQGGAGFCGLGGRYEIDPGK